MQTESWMQPALQASEAVLLPAMERCSPVLSRYSNRYLPSSGSESVFRPASEVWEREQPLALSTWVRPRGSMAGRSVLRAAGIHTEPVYRRGWQRRMHRKSCRVIR